MIGDCGHPKKDSSQVFVEIIESERGWGSHVEDRAYFDTIQEADAFVKDYNTKYNSAPTVPDWYMAATAPQIIRR